MAVSYTEAQSEVGRVARRGWRELGLALYGNVSEHRVTAIAGGVAFFALLAIFPFLAAIVAVYGLFADPAAIGSYLDQLANVLPSGAIDVVGDQLKRLASGPKATLGFAFLLSLALSLWSANAGMKAMFDALNIVYDAKETRGFIRLNAISLLFTVGAVAFMLVALAAVVVLPAMLSRAGLGSGAEWMLTVLRWPVLLVVLMLALAVIYRFGPCRDNAQWHWITVGSATAALLWLAASMLFSWYAASFGSFNKTYGSLGAMIGFMTWMWLSAIVILAGAEIDAILERADRGTAK